MKAIIKLGFAAIIIASTLFSSCGKYEDGPKISLASKKARLCRTWTVEKWIDGPTGAEVSCTANCGSTEFKKDGTFYSNGVSVAGVTWRFSSDKSKLETVYGTIVSSDKILRLTSKELWLKDESSGDQTHYKAI